MGKNKKFLYLCIVFIIFAGVVYQHSCGNKSSDKLVLSDSIQMETKPTEYGSIDNSKVSSKVPRMSDYLKKEKEINVEKEEENETTGVCYVCGFVKKPGVYCFIGGERVNDLILKAGGFTKQAAPESLNLAKMVSDGEKIYVPSVEEAKTLYDSVFSTSDDDRVKATGRININKANAKELTVLPGVGQVKAEMIILYRKEHGNFKCVEELKNIEGIKERTFEKFKDLITV